jgi:hypothetical protein
MRSKRLFFVRIEVYLFVEKSPPRSNDKVVVFARSEVGGGEGTAEESPPAGRLPDETDYFLFADHPRVGLFNHHKRVSQG